MKTGNPQKDTHWLRWLLGLWLLMSCILLAFRWQNVDFLILADTDDNLRLAQVKAWLGGQSWSDLRQYKLNPPLGADIHWSRLPDIPLAAIMGGLAPFIGWLAAEKIAIAVAPLLPFGLALLALALIARRLVDQRAWPFAAALLFCAPSTLGMFVPTRIDHHGWQLAFLAVILSGLVDPRRWRGGIVAGLGTAFSLAVGMEMLPYLALIGGLIGLRWVADDRDHAGLRAYGVTLAAGTALGFLVFASNANQAPRCDALTPVWLSTMVLAGACLVALSFIPARKAVVRLGLAALAGLILAALFVSTWPHCISRPEGISDELYRLWFVNITEVRPLSTDTLSKILTTLALPVSGLVGALWMAWADKARAKIWAQIALLGLVSILMLFWQTRAAPAAQLIGSIGATGLAWTILPPLSRARFWPARTLGVLAAFAVISGLAFNIGSALWPAAPAKSTVRAAARTASARCTTLSSLRPIAKIPAATMFTFVDLSPRLVAMTPHKAIAGPYHRNGDAILDVFAVFRGQPNAARTIIMAHGADYVLICPNMAEGANHRKAAPKGFLAQLEKDQVPDWLTPVALPDGSPFRMWKVLPADAAIR